ncbi:MAG: hypothetical protein ILP10_05735 [Lachnospiraceae bacterium]|nr:hypothetical protein [Lachnospiraceae bacterium]
MKKKLIKVMAVIMCAAFLTAGIGTASYAARGEDSDAAVAGNPSEANDSATANDTAKEDAATDAGDAVKCAVDEKITTGSTEETHSVLKDETVYVIADANGSSEKVIVSDWLRNSAGKTSVEDGTELGDIEVVKGDATYKRSGSSTVWDANGGEVYYQGTTDKALPVDVKISYELDGKVVQPDDLEGRNGRLRIRFDFDNRESENVVINGKEEKIYIPFAMLTGMGLDNDVFTNIEISNGEQINDGDRTIVTGIALPGLAKDLAIENDVIEIPESFEITADVEGYEQPMTMIVASGDLFGKIKTDRLDTIDGLGDALDELEDGAKQLVDGSSELYDGLALLLEKSGDLADGIDALAGGAGKLKDGTSSLGDGAGKLADGAAQLSNGLDSLAGNNDALRLAAEQVYATMLATADKELKDAGLDVPALTRENYRVVLGDLIDMLNGMAMNEQAEMITNLKTSVDGFDAFYNGLVSYTDGVEKAAEGAKTLKNGCDGLKTGADELKDGAGKLDDGLKVVKDSMPTLLDGISQLKDGAGELSEGMKKFYEQGIEKLVQAARGDVEGLAERIRAVRNVSEHYNNFSGLGEGMEGTVKFIYRIGD